MDPNHMDNIAMVYHHEITMVWYYRYLICCTSVIYIICYTNNTYIYI